LTVRVYAMTAAILLIINYHTFWVDTLDRQTSFLNSSILNLDLLKYRKLQTFDISPEDENE